MDEDQALADVRREIDAIDDAIHDLIMRRTALVEAVRDLKRGSTVKIRPSREAQILYRLMRRHSGPFPKRELAAIWRQLIVATLAFEGPFSVAVYMPGEDGAYWDLARDHFGLFTPMTRHGSVRAVIEAVHRQDAVVGVLPLPQQDDKDPWWRHLVTANPEAPKIIARLPFAGPGNGLGGRREALAICPVAPTPTGRDRSLFAVDTEVRLGLNQLRTRLAEAGLAPGFVASWHEGQGPSAWFYLAEVEGFVEPGDRRLAAFAEALGDRVNPLIRLGAYASPLTAEELGPERAAVRDDTGARPALAESHRR